MLGWVSGFAGGLVVAGGVEGEGSEFWIELPHGIETGVSSSQRLARERPSAAGRQGGVVHRVVYVEDNPSNVAFMEDLLEDFDGAVLTTAPSAEIGIEITARRDARTWRAGRVSIAGSILI